MNAQDLTITLCASFLLALLVSFISTTMLIKIGKKLQIVDFPNERKVHRNPIPRIGGLAFYFTFLICFVFILVFLPRLWNDKFLFILIGLTLMAIIGSYDDVKGISPIKKLLSQICVGLIMYHLGLKIEKITNPFTNQIIYLDNILNGIIPPIITVVWYVVIINAINIIDGLDGLAAGVTCISSLSLFFISLYMRKNDFVVTIPTIIVVGATLGFLKFNYHPAKIFMGDTGSFQLGFLLATVGLISEAKGQTTIALLAPIIILGVPIFDTLLAVIRRLLNKKKIFMADKKHLHHRLLALGLSQKQVVKLIYFICIYLGVISFILASLPAKYILLMLLILAMGLFLGLEVLDFIEKALISEQDANKKNSRDNKSNT